jgi:uncharacterized integral membrane protein
MGLIVTVPFLLFLLLFALSNREMVPVALWPTDWSVDVMLSVVVLGAAGIAFLLGALTVWLTEIGRRSRLRRAEQKVTLLQAQLDTLKSRPGQPQISVDRR